MKKYDNSVRLGSVTERDWRLALDELAAYLTWRLRGKTARGAHSERALGMPAFDYYQEEAVVKLIKGQWRWQPRYTLGQQLVEIASNLWKISWRRKWQLTPVFLPGKSHGQRNLVGYSPWGHKELDTTE